MAATAILAGRRRDEIVIYTKEMTLFENDLVQMMNLWTLLSGVNCSQTSFDDCFDAWVG